MTKITVESAASFKHNDIIKIMENNGFKFLGKDPYNMVVLNFEIDYDGDVEELVVKTKGTLKKAPELACIGCRVIPTGDEMFIASKKK